MNHLSPLPDHVDADAPFFVMPSGEVSATYGRWFSDARRVSEELSAGASVVCATEDRYLAMVVLLGTWLRAGRAVFPANLSTGAVDAASREADLVLVDRPHPGRVDLTVLLASDPSSSGSGAEEAPPVLDLPEDLSILRVFTSGSTGEALGMDKTAGQLLREPPVLARLMELEPCHRVMVTAPISHVYGLVAGHLTATKAGASMVHANPHWAQQMADVARDSGATHWVTVPAHLAVVADSQRNPVRPTWVTSAAARLPEATAIELNQLGFRVREIFGSTETGAIASRVVGQGAEGAPDVNWTPLPCVDLRTDQDDRLLVRSPFNANPEEFFPIGDRAEVLADGSYRHLGRSDGVLKIGAKRISLQRIEGLATNLKGVRDAVAIPIETTGVRNQTSWLAVETDTLTASDIRAELVRELDPVTVPRRIRVTRELPRDHRGKLNRSTVKELFREQSNAKVPAEHSSSVVLSAHNRRFQGHFPEYKLLPGLAQLHDLVLPRVRQTWPDLGPLSRIARLKFLAPIRPGDELDIHLSRKREGAAVRFQMECAGTKVSTGLLRFGGAP